MLFGGISNFERYNTQWNHSIWWWSVGWQELTEMHLGPEPQPRKGCIHGCCCECYHWDEGYDYFFLVFVSWNYISNHDDWNQWIIYFSTTLVTSLSTIILKTQQVLPNKHSFPRWRMRSLTKWPENRPRDISHLSFRGWVKTLAKWSNELPQLNAGDAVRWWLQPVSCVPALVGSW